MGEKTLEPKTCAPGAVRSVAPSAPPLGCHCAAMTFCVLVRAMRGRLSAPRSRRVVHADNLLERLLYRGRTRRQPGAASAAIFLHVDKDLGPGAVEHSRHVQTSISLGGRAAAGAAGGCQRHPGARHAE